MRPNRPNQAASTSLPRLGFADALLLTAYAGFFLFVSYIGSRGHMFWSDEVMGWLVIRSDSWHQLLTRWNAGIDSSGIFFYLLGRPWMAVFGHSEMALRFFSATGVIIAFAITWVCARRFFGTALVALTLPIPFVVNPILVWQLSNARCYGLVLASIALASYAFLITNLATVGSAALESAAPDSPARGRAFTFAAFLLMAGSHILGAFFCFCFFCGFVARDLYAKRFRVWLYLCALAGLIVVPFSYRNITSTTAAGKPAFWTIRPTLKQLPLGLWDLCKPLGAVLVAAALFAVAMWLLAKRRRSPDQLSTTSRRPLYALLLVYLFMVVATFVVSRVTTSIFSERYLLPSVLADALLLCALLSGLAERVKLSGAARYAVLALAPVFTVAVWFGFTHVLRRNFVYPYIDNTAKVLAALPAGEPVVVTNLEEWIDMTHYRNHDRAFFTPIDWQITLDPSSHPGGASGVHSMEYWKSQGLYADQILPTPELLRRVGSSFVVVSGEDDTLWFRRRIVENPQYTVQELPPLSFWHLRLWQVHLRPGPANMPLTEARTAE